MPRPMTTDQLGYFVRMLEDPDASDTVRALAEHLVKMYFNDGAEAAGDEWLRLRARDDVNAFAEYVFGYVPAAHHREITKVLDDPRRKRTVIVAHPQSAKSTYVSLIYPTFIMGKYPDSSTIMLAESFSQVEKYNSQIRPIVKGSNETGKRFKAVFPEAVPDEDQGWTREKLYLANRTRPIKDPNLFFSGVGSSSIQGSRADFILLDDIVGPDKIRSATEMAKVREDLHNLIVPRLHPDGRIICVMTRWAANDLAELFLKEMNFEMVYMPALSDDPRGAYVEFIPSKSYLRYPQEGDKAEVPQWVEHPDPEKHIQAQLQEFKAEALADGFRAEISTSQPNYDLPCVRKFLHADNDPVLWPQLFTEDALTQKRGANPISFRLVYNGDPTGISGDVFKREWFLTYGGEDDAFKRVPLNARYFMTVDVAVGGSRKGRGDYFVCLVVAIDDYGNKFIVDCLRSNSMLPPKQRKEIQKLYQERYPQTMGILIESTNYQAALGHELEVENLPVIPYKPIKNKDLRIESSSIYWAQGKIFLPHTAPWKNDFIDEHTQYPRGKHDDQIDAGAQLWEFLSTFSLVPSELEVSFG